MKIEKNAGSRWVLVLAAVAMFGCGGDSLPQTLGEVCTRIGTSVCDRTVACMLATSAEKPQCQTDFQDGCCTMDGTCSDKPVTPQAQQDAQKFIDACQAALKTFDCAQLGAGNAPAECLNPP